MEIVTNRVVVEDLKNAISAYPTAKEWANAYQIQPKNLYQVLAGKRSVPDNICSILGYVRVKAFRKLK